MIDSIYFSYRFAFKLSFFFLQVRRQQHDHGRREEVGPHHDEARGRGEVVGWRNSGTNLNFHSGKKSSFCLLLLKLKTNHNYLTVKVQKEQSLRTVFFPLCFFQPNNILQSFCLNGHYYIRTNHRKSSNCFTFLT
jgi:hypothetical protein